MKNAAGEQIFKNLQKVISLLLILPFSNVKVERIFSQVNLNKTPHRNKTNKMDSVAILATKEGIEESGGILKFNPPNKMLEKKIWDSDHYCLK